MDASYASIARHSCEVQGFLIGVLAWSGWLRSKQYCGAISQSDAPSAVTPSYLFWIGVGAPCLPRNR